MDFRRKFNEEEKQQPIADAAASHHGNGTTSATQMWKEGEQDKWDAAERDEVNKRGSERGQYEVEERELGKEELLSQVEMERLKRRKEDEREDRERQRREAERVRERARQRDRRQREQDNRREWEGERSRALRRAVDDGTSHKYNNSTRDHGGHRRDDGAKRRSRSSTPHDGATHHIDRIWSHSRSLTDTVSSSGRSDVFVSTAATSPDPSHGGTAEAEVQGSSCQVEVALEEDDLQTVPASPVHLSPPRESRPALPTPQADRWGPRQGHSHNDSIKYRSTLSNSRRRSPDYSRTLHRDYHQQPHYSNNRDRFEGTHRETRPSHYRRDEHGQDRRRESYSEKMPRPRRQDFPGPRGASDLSRRHDNSTREWRGGPLSSFSHRS